MPEQPTGTVTFLFTDIEGSTQLLRRLREQYGGTLALHQQLVREAVESRGGFEVDTQGDAFFFVFQHAANAVQAAIDAQRSLAAHEWPEEVDVRVRMGLHSGAARFEHGRYVGLPVHRAARICSLGHGGQVLLSDATKALLADDEELTGIGFRDLGPIALKDFDTPTRVYRLAVPGVAEVDRRPRARAARRRWKPIALAGLAVLGAALAAVLVTSSGGGHAGIRISENSVAIIDPANGKVDTAVAVGRGPGSIVLDPNAAWVANRSSDTITRIDESTYAASTFGGLPSSLYALAVGEGRVWATEMTGGLATVNVADQTVSPPVPLLVRGGVAYSAEGIAYGFGSLWIGGGLPNELRLLRVDPATDRIERVSLTHPIRAATNAVRFATA